MVNRIIEVASFSKASRAGKAYGKQFTLLLRSKGKGEVRVSSLLSCLGVELLLCRGFWLVKKLEFDAAVSRC
jgi:hypothetical protein